MMKARILLVISAAACFVNPLLSDRVAALEGE